MSSVRKKVVCAMSGGVDSSVAAALLLQQGYDVVGVFMRLGTPAGVDAHLDDVAGKAVSAGGVSDDESCNPKTKNKQGCCSVLDAADAHRVAGVLGIPLYVLNFQEDFGRVIDYFVSEYNRGRTPNPCVRCNDWLKFGKLAKYAEAIGAEYVASGHYARIGIDAENNQPVLMRGVDHRKDQSYVLFGMSASTVAHTLLPVGAFEKTRVRELAQEMNLPVYNKPDSQEICFVPNQDYAGLVQRRSPGAFRQGDLVNAAGEKIGTHGGHQHFTVGQRKGMGVALGYPIYVVDINAERNQVTVGEKQSLMKRALVANDINILSHRLRAGVPRRCEAKIRYNHSPQPATVTHDGNELRVIFDEPQSAITPGQAVVIFDGDVVLGGGWIEAANLGGADNGNLAPGLP